MAIDNSHPLDSVVDVNVAGQIHGQVRDLPEEAEISISTDLEALGRVAIETALHDLHGGTEPVGTFAPDVPYSAGGPDPLDAILIYARDEPQPHWHLVGLGMSEPRREGDRRPGGVGLGHRVQHPDRPRPQEKAPPMWSAVLLQQLARYVIAERPFAPGHTIHVARGTFGDRPAQGAEPETELAALAFAVDPELTSLDTPHGRVTFLQIAALTEAEYAAAKGSKSMAVLAKIEQDVPMHIVNRNRSSVL